MTRDGIVLAKSDGLTRHYPLKEDTPHFIGYVDVTTEKTFYSSFEKTYNDSLSKGNSLSLTIDSRIQAASTRILKQANQTGAIVVSDPNTGAILAMASFPHFDPNLYASGISTEDYRRLNDDPRLPRLDRAIQPRPPGGVGEILTALASQYKGLENPEYLCEGAFLIGKRKYRDWKKDRNETLDLPSALKSSCNTYFYQLGLETGYDAMKATSELLHIGQNPLFSEYGKSSWMTKRGGDVDVPWTDGDIANSSVGMGFTQIRPYEINAITAAIATGVWKMPYVVERPSGPEAEVTLIGKGQITQESLNLIQKGMFESVNNAGGLANEAQINGWTVAGKTGRAPQSRNTMVRWFTSYAPANNPKYCLTVIVDTDRDKDKLPSVNPVNTLAKPMLEFLRDNDSILNN